MKIIFLKTIMFAIDRKKLFTLLKSIILFFVIVNNLPQLQLVVSNSNFNTNQRLNSMNNCNNILPYQPNLNLKIKMNSEYKISEEINDGAFLPDIAIDNNGNLHAVWYSEQESGENIIYRMYNAVEKQWSNATIISSNSLHSYAKYPRIKVDINNNIHVIWREQSDYTYLKYRCLLDNIWQPPVNIICLNRTTFAHDFVIDSEENIHFIWNDINNTDNYEIFFRSYSLLTQELSDYQQITNSSFASVTPNLAIDSIDNLYLIWHDSTENYSNGEIFYVKTSDKNWTCCIPIAISNIDSVLSGRPSIVMDNKDILHITWEDSTHPFYNIYYRNINSTNQLSDIQLINTNDGFFPDIFCDKSNNIYIVWYEDFKIQYCYYSNNREWSIPAKILNQDCDLLFPQIIVNENQIFTIWNDYSHEQSWQIYFISGKFRNFIYLYITIPIVFILFITTIIAFIIFRKKRLVYK